MDTYGIEQLEEEELKDMSPTLEEVKRVVNNKRLQKTSKTYTREDRIKNLELAREKKKLDKLKATQKINNPMPIIENVKETPKTNFNDYNDIINELKNITALQYEYFEKMKAELKTNTKKPRTPRKPKEQKRTLDITINDNEIKNIIENKSTIIPYTANTNSNEPKQDPKLKAFLDALNKN